MAGETEGPSVGALTTAERDFWAEARGQLIADGNLAALEAVQSAILLLCLDAASPEADDDVDRLLLHGGPGAGNNRWFDKSLQFVVFGNGKAGLNFEHSMFDAAPVVHVMNAVLQSLVEDRAPARVPVRQAAPEPQPVSWTLGPSSLRYICEAVRRFDARASGHDLKVLHFGAFGTAELKRLKCSPDAFAQLGFQLACARVFGRCRPTYAASATNRFRHGRTETIRSVSTASAEWVAAMQEPCGPAVRWQKLRAALARQVWYARRAAEGLGVDRHLFGLQQMLRPGEAASLFEDPMYGRSKRWELSTSATGSAVLYAGFGEVVEDGIGLCYCQKDEAMTFVVTSRSKADRWAPRVCEELQTALLQMRDLCAAATSASKL